MNVYFSEKFIDFQLTEHWYILEHKHVRNHRSGNLESYN
jgi:hypothetical protein